MKTLRNLLIAGGILMSVGAQADTLTFGIVPQQSAKKLAKLWTPVTAYLSEKTGHDIKFTTAKNIPTFEKRLQKGDYDIAYMNPYHFTVFNQKPGYKAIARQKNKRIKGIMVVRKDSSFADLNGLDGSKLAFPSPAAFAASVVPRANLTQKGIEFDPKYVSSHDSVYLNVAKGIFPAGGGVIRTFNNTDPAVRDQLKVLWTTDGYTPHAVAVGPDVSSDAAAKLQQALVDMATDPKGAELLKKINFKAFTPASDNDWDDVRGLNITLLDHML
ncbi:phosphate/phosphite/phosphonate ABC transporter substrate-binding protein [Aliamphritea ceti]